MKYSIDNYVFEKNPNVCFGIVIGRNLKNMPTTTAIDEQLAKEENQLRKEIPADQLKEHPSYLNYRNALRALSINPNKYMNSIEAMTKRVLKGQQLPRINALVDDCNAIGLRHKISLGGHDLKDIKADLSVRLSKNGDIFLPFGQTEFEDMPEGELVFTSGVEVQTRHWLWRQSELGKMTLDTKDVFFQLVGFENNIDALKNALKDLEATIESTFNGTYETFIVKQDNPTIEF